MDVRSIVHKMIKAGLVKNFGESTLCKWNIHFLKGGPIVLARNHN